MPTTTRGSVRGRGRGRGGGRGVGTVRSLRPVVRPGLGRGRGGARGSSSGGIRGGGARGRGGGIRRGDSGRGAAVAGRGRARGPSGGPIPRGAAAAVRRGAKPTLGDPSRDSWKNLVARADTDGDKPEGEGEGAGAEQQGGGYFDDAGIGGGGGGGGGREAHQQLPSWLVPQTKGAGGEGYTRRRRKPHRTACEISKMSPTRARILTLGRWKRKGLLMPEEAEWTRPTRTLNFTVPEVPPLAVCFSTLIKYTLDEVLIEEAKKTEEQEKIPTTTEKPSAEHLAEPPSATLQSPTTTDPTEPVPLKPTVATIIPLSDFFSGTDKTAANNTTSGANSQRIHFHTLPLSDPTSRALMHVFKFPTMTPIQEATIPPALEGMDVLGVAPTGSGKTLAFLIPCVEILEREKFKPEMGVGALILSPTREIATQNMAFAKQLLTYHTHTSSLLVGGGVRIREMHELQEGANLVIATPGRFVDHLSGTHGMKISALKILVFDEVDRLLDKWFEQELKRIMEKLPPRQTLMFTATINYKVNEVAAQNLNNPVLLDLSGKDVITVPTLKQYYMLCPTKLRVDLLNSFVKLQNKKIIVFFNTCAEVLFFTHIFRKLKSKGKVVTSIHGELFPSQRIKALQQFTSAETGIIFCTDVAARGVDFPEVDWLIQFDIPSSPEYYVHRVGRTARAGKEGKAILFVQPCEEPFVGQLLGLGIPIKQKALSRTMTPTHKSFAIHIKEDPTCYYLASEAVHLYLHAFGNYRDPYAHAGPINDLDLAYSFGFSVIPERVDKPSTLDVRLRNQERIEGMWEFKGENKGEEGQQQQTAGRACDGSDEMLPARHQTARTSSTRGRGARSGPVVPYSNSRASFAGRSSTMSNKPSFGTQIPPQGRGTMRSDRFQQGQFRPRGRSNLFTTTAATKRKPTAEPGSASMEPAFPASSSSTTNSHNTEQPRPPTPKRPRVWRKEEDSFFL
ncbi:ATP-dependent RNA helicase HAS1 [Pelomyxa schiedti]|nr:ATP-dependent RNA helicase HAS1 [Pelomyxa schiedti]